MQESEISDSSQIQISDTNIEHVIMETQSTAPNLDFQRHALGKMWNSEVFHSSQVQSNLKPGSRSQLDVIDSAQDLEEIKTVDQILTLEDNSRTQIAESAKNTEKIDTHAGGPSRNESNEWKGLLYKRSTGIVGSWQVREFLLTAQAFVVACKETVRPVLSYRSKTKGGRSFIIKDVRREQHLDIHARICFSVGLIESEVTRSLLNLRQLKKSQERTFLMAVSDTEAVALLTRLRRILEPGRELPTPWEVMHFPAQALAKLA
jgi:hypothetical protein